MPKVGKQYNILIPCVSSYALYERGRFLARIGNSDMIIIRLTVFYEYIFSRADW